jgi:hypothetical protein
MVEVTTVGYLSQALEVKMMVAEVMIASGEATLVQQLRPLS